MALPSSKPAGSDFPPEMIIIKGGHRRGGAGGYIHVRSLRRRETRSSGRADQDGGDPRRRSPRRSNSLASRDALPLSRPTFRAQTTAEAARSFALHLRPSPNAPTLAARARAPFAHGRCAGPVGRGCGHSPRRRRTSCPIRVPLRPPGRPRCAPSSLAPAALHSPLRSPRRSILHLHEIHAKSHEIWPVLHGKRAWRGMCPTLIHSYLATFQPIEGRDLEPWKPKTSRFRNPRFREPRTARFFRAIARRWPGWAGPRVRWAVGQTPCNCSTGF